MRVVVLAAPGALRLEDRPIPDPGPQQVRIQLQGCGVCGSNLPVWEGRDWFDYPREAGTPGHEGWGIVDAIGEDVTSMEPGDRVAALSYNAFSEYDLADVDAVVRLPERLAGLPFPGEPLGCAMNVFRRADVRVDQTVAIVGVGFLGALLTQLASRSGARVLAISRRAYSRQVAEDMGADEALPMDDNVVGQVEELTDGAGCDRVIEAVGLQGPLDVAAEITRERGRLVIAGFHQDGLRTVDMQLWNWRGLDVINAHERASAEYVRGMRAAIEAVEAGTLDPYPLFTHSFGLDAADQALQLLIERPDGFMKALIEAGV